MDDRNKGYNMTNDVLDLCSSDEENPGRQIEFLAQVIDLEITSTNPKVASRPQVVNLLDSDEDENDLDQKPAAKPRSRNLARKRARVSQGEIIDLESLSPQRDNKFPQPRNTGILTPPDFSNLVQVVPASPNRISSLDRVLEVFPDVDRNHAQKTLRDFNNHVEMVLSLLAEGSYPRSKHNTQKTAPFASINLAASVLVKRNKVHPKYDFMSRSSFEPSPIYIQEATKQLLHEFPFVSIHGMKALLQKQLNHYTIVRVEILNALKGSSTKAGATTEDNEVKQFQSLKIVWATKRPTAEQSSRIGPQYCVKRVIPRPIPVITDTILKEEIHYAKLQLEEWMQSMEQRIKRQEARKRSEKVGSGVECACCFDKVPIEEMVACRNEGHLFCADCIQNYADTQVFSNGSLGVVKATGKPSCELLCCDSSGCQSGFQEEHLQKALSLKTLEKYHELVFRAIIEAAGIQEEMCSCPKCGFQADLPLNLIVFQCPVEDCRYESCRKCGKEAHVPFRCDEVVQKKREDEGRLKVEEAMAEAKIRKCPKCKTPFVKSDGCNKMICRCGTKMCYICRAVLTGVDPYAHFCRIPHCNHKTCKNCTLYSNAEEDDKRAIREAGLTAAKKFREELKEREQDRPEINIDVDQILRPVVPVVGRDRMPGRRHRAQT